MKVRFIINPAAGGPRPATKITEAVRNALLSEEGFFEIKVASIKGSAKELSREAVQKGYDAVFACGGDGTVNEVASQLVDTKVVLGIIPIGSGNGLVKALGIPEDIEGAINLLKRWKVREIDVGVISGRFFFATAGCGFDAYLSKKYNEGSVSRRLRGMLPYYLLAVREFFRYKPGPVVIKTRDFSKTVTPFLLTAANTDRYGGNAVIAPGARPDDGLLDLSIVPMIGIRRVFGLALKILSGRINEFRGYERVLADSIEITGKGISLMHADGEPFECEGDILITVLPRKIKVLVA